MQKKKIILTILAIIILTVLIFGGVFAWQYYSTKNINSKIQTQNNQTGDWKTYTNNQYGFSFQYPPEISIQGFKTQVSVLTSDLYKSQQSFDDYSLEVQNMISSEKNQTADESVFYRIVKNFDILGKRALISENTGYPSRVSVLDTIVDLNGKYYLDIEIGPSKQADINKLSQNDYSDFKDLENLNNQIISTFKFIK